MASNSEEVNFQEWRQNKLKDLKYHRAVCLLICGADLTMVSKELGLSKRQIQRFFESPDFNENLNRAVQITFRSSLSHVALYMDKAIQILISISEDVSQPAKYRIQAISELFKLALSTKLNATPATDLELRLHSESRLLNYYSSIKSITSEIREQGIPPGKLNIENQRAIWEELYPHEIFPDEELYRRWFEEKED